jgi:hypothetical protein
MADYLDEDYFSAGLDLYFPRVQTCCAIVVTSTLNNNLAGYHCTTGTNGFTLDRVLRRARISLGGNIDGVYLVGNVLGRNAGVDQATTYPQNLKTTIGTALDYQFNLKYRDTLWNHTGVAVRAWRDPMNNHLRLCYAAPGNWAAGPLVVCSPNVLRIRGGTAYALDGNNAPRVRTNPPPPGGVLSCVLHAVNNLQPFLMESF